MKKNPRFSRVILISMICMGLFLTSAYADNNKPDNGALTLPQVVGGFLVLVLVILIPLIKSGKSADINNKKII